MDLKLMNEYTNSLYELVKNHFGSRFMGYSFVSGNGSFLGGYIEGRIDLKKFGLHVTQNIIRFDAKYEPRLEGSLINEMKNLILETFDKDDVRSCLGSRDFESDKEEFDIHLNYRIDCGKEYRFCSVKGKK